jgi:hypothetical protein
VTISALTPDGMVTVYTGEAEPGQPTERSTASADGKLLLGSGLFKVGE